MTYLLNFGEVVHQQKFQNLVLVGSLCKGYASKMNKYQIFTYLVSFCKRCRCCVNIA